MINPIFSNSYRAIHVQQQDDKKKLAPAPQDVPETPPPYFMRLAVERCPNEWVMPIADLFRLYFDEAKANGALENSAPQETYRLVVTADDKTGMKNKILENVKPGVPEADTLREKNDIAAELLTGKGNVIPVGDFLRIFYTSVEGPRKRGKKGEGPDEKELAEVRPDLVDPNSYVTWAQLKNKNIFVTPENPLTKMRPGFTIHSDQQTRQLQRAMNPNSPPPPKARRP